MTAIYKNQMNTLPSKPTADTLSIILPALNEEKGLSELLPSLLKFYKDAEIIVVDSGSTDSTTQIAKDNGVKIVAMPYAYGNGAAIKSGIRAASGELLILMDADGQHKVEDISKLLEKIDQGYDMAVGARHSSTQATFGRRIANTIYNRFASWMTNRKIEDLTSGMRAVKSRYAREFLHLYPNGFSYPTTITMAFFRSGLSVSYVPIKAGVRKGSSHINPLRDGIRFLLIIFKIGTLYSPLKVFMPLSLIHFLAALGYYGYTFITMHRLTNMSVILFSISSLIFLMGLLSEQITNLYYAIHQQDR